MEQREKDEKYMREALKQARKAAALGETPIGCVIVRTRHVGPEDFENGKRVTPESGSASGEVFEEKIIARGYNRRNTDHTALAHAEIAAIKKASKEIGDWRLEGCTMFVTLEPCPMCTGAIILSRISTVVFGAKDELTGSCGSVIDLFSERYGHSPAVFSGVLADESRELLSAFFKKIRLRADSGELTGNGEER